MKKLQLVLAQKFFEFLTVICMVWSAVVYLDYLVKDVPFTWLCVYSTVSCYLTSKAASYQLYLNKRKELGAGLKDLQDIISGAGSKWKERMEQFRKQKEEAEKAK